MASSKKKGAASEPEINLTDSAPPSEEAPKPTVKWGTGHLRDEYDARDWNLSAMLGAAARLPSESTIAQYVTELFDQGPSRSCVAQAAIGAGETRSLIEGRPFQRPSRRGLYDLARAVRRRQGEALQDLGCYPRDLFRVWRDVGCPLESTVPFSIPHINDELEWRDLTDASAHRITGWYRVDARGSHLLEQIAQAITKGYPVIFGASVGPRFMDLGRDQVVEPESESVGGHMVGIYGYRHDARQFLLRNSYGVMWGTGGFAWADASFLTDERSSDFYVVTL